jgi:single-strand DNA-binding protein
MFETPLTVVGRIITDPRRRRVADQEVISFRLASNSRRRDADGNWEPGNSLYVTVNCWGKLVTGVGAALGKGAAVIAVGHVYTSEYDDKDGLRRSSLEMRATSVGPDLSKAIVKILDPISTATKDDPAPAPEEHDSAAAEPATSVAAGPPADGDEPLTSPAQPEPPKVPDPTVPAKVPDPTVPAKVPEGKGRKALPLSA